jgi:hypothetical protein
MQRAHRRNKTDGGRFSASQSAAPRPQLFHRVQNLHYALRNLLIGSTEDRSACISFFTADGR